MTEHPTNVYAYWAVSDKAHLCKREKQACQRHLDDLNRQRTKDFPFVFDETRADRVFDWFETLCRHVRGPFAGQLIQLLDWQKFDLGCKYGWVHKDTGARRFVKAFNERARGNVKSTEMSGLALFFMCSDASYPPGETELRHYEESPEVECAAVDRGQAKRVWLDAHQMGQKSPEIAERLILKRTYVEHKTRGGWLRPLSKETKNKDSGAPCLVIIDEYHAHPTSEIVDVLFSGFGKRLQSMMEIISTAGKDAENNPCKKEYDLGCQILDGEVLAEDYFVMIREMEPGDSPEDETAWIKANPILQVDNVYAQTLRKQIKSECEIAFASNDPAKKREFLTKRCNLWQQDSELKFLDSDTLKKWKALAVSREEFAELVRGLDTWTGVDLSKTIDLSADAFTIPLPDGRIAITAHGFLPEEAVRRHEQSDRIPYKAWARENWLTITDGAVTDQLVIKAHIQADEKSNAWTIQEICYDPYNAGLLMRLFEQEGYTPIEIRQGVQTLSEPTKELRAGILSGKFVHDGSPLLTWALANAYEVSDSNGNIKLSKKHKDDTQRIDPAAAVINSLVRSLTVDDINDYIGSDDWGL